MLHYRFLVFVISSVLCISKAITTQQTKKRKKISDLIICTSVSIFMYLFLLNEPELPPKNFSILVGIFQSHKTQNQKATAKLDDKQE